MARRKWDSYSVMSTTLLDGDATVRVRMTPGSRQRVQIQIGGTEIYVSVDVLRTIVNDGADVLDKWFDEQETAVRP